MLRLRASADRAAKASRSRVVRSLEQGDLLCRRRPGGLELRADPRALLARGEQLFLQPGPRSVALGQQGRELCGASSVEHAPDNRRGRDGDEQGDQRQIQVHDGRFTTLRPFFAGGPLSAVRVRLVGGRRPNPRTREPRTRGHAQYNVDPTALGSKLGLLWS